MKASVPVVLRRGRPVAPMQRPLWVSQRRHPDAPVQNMALLSHLDGAIDPARFVEAFGRVVAASDALRTTVLDEGAAPSVVVADDVVATEVIELPRSEAVDWAEQRARVPLTVRRCGYDSVLLRHDDGTSSWYLCLHHTITDATSSALVFAATAEAYGGADVSLASYYDWVASLDEPGDPRRERARAHWRDRPTAPGIGRFYRATRSPQPAAERHEIELGEDDWRRVETALASDYPMISDDLAWSTLLTTAVAVHLHRITRADRFSIGLPVHNRGDEVSRSLIGPVMEVFPVDVDVEPGDTFRSLHRRIGRSVMTTLRQARPGTAPAADYEAVVNVILRADLGFFGTVPATTRWIHSGAIDASHLLRVQLTAYGGRPGLALDLNESTAGAEHRRRAGCHFASVLRSMVADPDAEIAAEPLLTEEERVAVERWGSGPAWPTAPVDVVTRLAEALAERTDVVLDDGVRRLTGAELWALAGDVARTLRAAGVGPGRRVGIEMPRSVDTVVAILATLVAGGSYVPLDPAQPESRRRRLAERADCVVVLTHLPASTPGTDRPAPAPPLGDEAYLLFTSGSTGEPKGVPITHLGLARYLEFAAANYVDSAAPPVAALFTALTFDLTVTSLFVPLLTGGRIVVIAEEGPAALSALAARTDITWAKATPSHLEVLHRLLPDDHALSTLVVGGEAFGAHLARRLFAGRDRLRIFNEYGPTEAVVGCMIHEATPAELHGATEVPIGRPAPGVTLRVVDPALGLVPPGAPGELLIGHEGLTAGYLLADDDPGDPTAGPFVVLDGARFYRSGDLVRMVDDETLEYLGRIDAQVKVGGIRLEPSEVESALLGHPAIQAAAVRLWTPRPAPDARRCVRCGLSSDVPGVTFDDAGVCSSCDAFESVAPQAEAWFRRPEDLAPILARARERATGDHDCLHLLSGGKDSTYALYQLVEHGFRPYALTLDNGFISEGAKDNVRRSVEHLGIDHEFVTTEAMNEIFRDSLERFSNVCNGCYKTLYTLATNRAVELGIPLIVTGLSRGQLFETRLVPQQFREGRFDPDAIDRAVVEARKAYHHVDDAARRLLDTSVFDSDDLFERIEFLDFYRYVDVPLDEMLRYLDTEAPWVRPADTGRSTNCLINVAGIHTHLTEQGFHNYAVPYAWDVRLGHKTRDEALEELDDDIDAQEVARLLGEVDYEPRSRPVLTAWAELKPGATQPTPAELRAFLADRVPAHAVPAAFVTVERLPFTTNGKLDTDALPPPSRVHRSGPALQVEPETDLERSLIAVWERILRIEPVGVEDDFFALGGDSLSALEMIVAVGDELGVGVAEELAFRHSTPRELAAAIESVADSTDTAADVAPHAWPAPVWDSPPLSDGEKAILYEQSVRDRALAEQGSAATDVRYNTARTYRVHAPIDGAAFADAVRQVAARHVPLSWSYATPRTRLAADAAVGVEIGDVPIDEAELAAGSARRHRAPFDLAHGPLLRVWVQPVDDGTTQVLVAMHHVVGDALSFDRLWEQIDAELHGRAQPALPVDYASFTQWQRHTRRTHELAFWQPDPADPVGRYAIAPPSPAEPDGYTARTISLTPDELRYGADVGGFATSLAAITAVLRRRVDGDRVATGFVVSTRTHPDATDLAGYFLNTLPVELDCGPATTLRELAAAARDAVNERLAHRTLPYAEILAARRSAGIAPAGLDVFMSFEELDEVRFGGARVDHDVLFNGTAVADATFFIQPRPDRVDVGVEHRGSTVSSAAAADLLADLDVALRTIVDAPDTPLADLALPSVADAVVHGAALPPQPAVPERVADWYTARADRPAVVCGDEALTWASLDGRVDAIAGGLAAAGVEPGDRVIVALPRAADVVATILAVWRCGASYVPVDPSHPAERIRLIAEEAEARIAVVADRTLRLTGGDHTVGELADARTDGPGPAHVADAGDEAYVMFTSGSTGRPRGVAVRHGELAASTGARLVHYSDTPGRFLVVSSAAFDSSVAGLFWTLATGGTVVLPTEREALDPAALVGLIERHEVTHTLMVPTLYRAVLEQGGDGGWPQRVIVAGEACPRTLVDRHHELRPDARLTNEYGPTEATVWATATDLVPGAGPVSIGGPIPGSWVAAVDPQGQPCPDGVEGELVVGGAGCTGGYVNDAATTAARFVTLPQLPGPGFLTGDRVVVRDGDVSYLGRVDHQLNVGGVRAEPEDIERVLTAVPGVAAAVVVAVDPRSLDDLVASADPDDLRAAMATAAGADDPGAALAGSLRAADPGSARLVAHLEAAPGRHGLILDTVRTRVSAELPPLMRPQRYAVHDALPRSPHGKIDRAAAARLPIDAAGAAPAHADHAGDDEGGPDELADTIAELMAGVLAVDQVDTGVSFFDVGGHSLLAMELLVRIEDRLGVRLDVGSLYDEPTPRAMAAVVRRATGRPPAAIRTDRFLAPIQPAGTKPPLIGVHVLGTNEEFYRPLAAALGDDQPFYGVTVPVDHPDPALTDDVGAICDAYSRAIADHLPPGPVGLVGMSLGGPVAFELARRLRAAGRDITVLAMLDAAGPDGHRFTLSRAERLRVRLGQLGSVSPLRMLADFLDYQRVRINRYAERIMLAVLDRLGRPLSARLRLRRIVEHNIAAVGRFRFTPAAQRVTVLKGGDDFSERLVANDMGWGRLALDGVDIVRVSGDHLTMVGDDHVAELAAALVAATDGPLAGRADTGEVAGSRDAVQAALVEALAADRLTAEVAHLMGQRGTLDPEASALVAEVAATTEELAGQVAAEAERVSAALADAGLTTGLAPTPSRLHRAGFTVRIGRRDVEPAITALADLGYQPQFPGRAGRTGRLLAGSMMLIATDSVSTRLNLVWDARRAARPGPPGRLRRVVRGLRRRLVRPDASASGRDLGPFLATPDAMIEPLLRFAGVGPDDLVVDLGCGDGRVVVEAARRFGCATRGVERDPRLAALARERAAAAGVAHLVDIVEGDVDPSSPAGATVVFCFLPPEATAGLLVACLDHLGPGGRFLTHEQLDTAWPVPPDRTELITGQGVTVARLWRT